MVFVCVGAVLVFAGQQAASNRQQAEVARGWRQVARGKGQVASSKRPKASGKRQEARDKMAFVSISKAEVVHEALPPPSCMAAWSEGLCTWHPHTFKLVPFGYASASVLHEVPVENIWVVENVMCEADGRCYSD